MMARLSPMRSLFCRIRGCSNGPLRSFRLTEIDPAYAIALGRLSEVCFGFGAPSGGMADLGREPAAVMSLPKSRSARVAPLAESFAKSDLTRLAISDGEFSLELVRRLVPSVPRAAEPPASVA